MHEDQRTKPKFPHSYLHIPTPDHTLRSQELCPSCPHKSLTIWLGRASCEVDDTKSEPTQWNKQTKPFLILNILKLERVEGQHLPTGFQI